MNLKSLKSSRSLYDGPRACESRLCQPLVFPSRSRHDARRRPISCTSATGPFAGMTAVALKALTSSNTTKNQRYLAAKLETQVIKKEGDRPESPGMKVRTVSQREADERGAKRKERAARRARRGEDVTEEEAMGMGHDEMDVDSDLDSSPLPRHRRGPGDEEDYETPRPNGKRCANGQFERRGGGKEASQVGSRTIDDSFPG
ncbi:hypothetical protein C8F01DRAFT_69162 [Mycena amicta]|nr:hypothetical protein C8F01DRAFT_69162 [Mycena amicta]